ncbi:MAG TPA: cupin domain-containing protein [Thermoanaerobaculia bacterium]|jgi:mannose-6-phosphate isomerase-like protein (cupin superfamily)|nr:cupin domain-containing protein [Thermoanaerobaculia bacterium]
MDSKWAAFRLSEIDEQRRRAGEAPWLEFLKVPSLRTGLYVLPAGSVDTQSPHAEDEVYYVVRGRGRFTADGNDMSVEAGAVLFVAAHAEHRFHSIEEDLEILVFFARV